MANKEIIAAKEALVNEVVEKIQKSKSVVLVNHCGLTVEQDTALRVEMRKAPSSRFRKMRSYRL